MDVLPLQEVVRQVVHEEPVHEVEHLLQLVHERVPARHLCHVFRGQEVGPYESDVSYTSSAVSRTDEGRGGSVGLGGEWRWKRWWTNGFLVWNHLCDYQYDSRLDMTLDWGIFRGPGRTYHDNSSRTRTPTPHNPRPSLVFIRAVWCSLRTGS